MMNDLSSPKEEIRYFRWPQDDALRLFLPILQPHLPHSNPLYNRLQAPHNTASRHCVFAATFPPGTTEVPEIFTILFADRSRHEESQIWTFNSLMSSSGPLTVLQQNVLLEHTAGAIDFLKDLSVPEAPRWPFSPILKLACIHERMTSTLVQISEPRDAILRHIPWNLWLVDTSTVSSLPKTRKSLPEGYIVTRVPDEQLDIVISTSSIPRTPSTYKQLPSVGVLDENGKLAAWGYVGIDGSFATLYVLPDFRGKGLSSIIARQLLDKLYQGDFSGLGYGGSSGWVHADVYDGNEGSEAVMRSLRGSIGWTSSYVWIDSAKF